MNDDVEQRWLPEFDKTLGQPTGPAVFVPAVLLEESGSAVEGVWHREFSSGTVAEFSVEPHCKGTIRWSDGTVTVGTGGCDETPTAPPGH